MYMYKYAEETIKAEYKTDDLVVEDSNFTSISHGEG